MATGENVVRTILVRYPRDPDLAGVATQDRHEVVLVVFAGELLRGQNPLDNRSAAQETL